MKIDSTLEIMEQQQNNLILKGWNLDLSSLNVISFREGIGHKLYDFPSKETFFDITYRKGNEQYKKKHGFFKVTVVKIKNG